MASLIRLGGGVPTAGPERGKQWDGATPGALFVSVASPAALLLVPTVLLSEASVWVVRQRGTPSHLSGVLAK